MNLRLRLIGGLVGLTTAGALLLAPAGVAASTTATSGAPATACTDGHWPAVVQGRPVGFHAGARAGDYIWHDATGWHVRVTHPGSARVVFSGRVVASAPITFTPVMLEKVDTITLSADRKTLTYRFVNFGGIDGFNFTTSCASRVSFGGRLDGRLLPTSHIWVGAAGRHPLRNPFTVSRIS